MFIKMRTSKKMKLQHNENRILVGYFGKDNHVARIHHYGFLAKVDKDGPEYQHPSRKLLGLTEADRVMIRESLLRHLAP